MLDLIITVEDSTTAQGSFSDHNIVHFSIQVPFQITKLKSIIYRKTKAINMDLLKKDILLEIPHHSDCNSLGKHIKLYNSSLREIIDKHAPLKKKVISESQRYHHLTTQQLKKSSTEGNLKRSDRRISPT